MPRVLCSAQPPPQKRPLTLSSAACPPSVFAETTGWWWWRRWCRTWTDWRRERGGSEGERKAREAAVLHWLWLPGEQGKHLSVFFYIFLAKWRAFLYVSITHYNFPCVTFPLACFLCWLSKKKNRIKDMVRDVGAWNWRNAHWLLITYFLPPTSPADCGNPASSWSPLHGQRWHLWPLRQGLRPPWQEEEVWHKGSQENAQSRLQWDLYFQGKPKHLVVTLYLSFIKTTCTSSCLMGRQVLLKVNCSSCLSLFLRVLSSCLDFFFTHTCVQQW